MSFDVTESPNLVTLPREHVAGNASEPVGTAVLTRFPGVWPRPVAGSSSPDR
jgi:hypothetical protein